ncbi:MAG: Fe-S cluster assembly protein IscX [Chloroflexi bacterium]|nr:Fe-S cluster assembly protein IscX [Chloroflexota bacterium]
MAAAHADGDRGFKIVMAGTKLYWDATYEIVLALMDAYPDIELEDLGLRELSQRIVDLPDFADDPTLVNDAILREILRDWYEEMGA